MSAVWAWILLHPAKAVVDELSPAGTDAGGVFVLEPERWIGKRFPLASEIEGVQPLLHGDWTIILFHHDCSTCREVVPKYLQATHEPNRASFRLAVVEIPPKAIRDLIDLSDLPAPGMQLSLREGREWFAQTPVVVLLKDGFAISTATGEAAADPTALLRQMKQH